MRDYSDREEIVVGKPVDDYFKNENINIITKHLDRMSGLSTEGDYPFHHYVLCTQRDYDDRLLVIRVPGGSVGYMTIDENDVITEIHVDTDYVITSYWRNVNKHLVKNYLGKKIIFAD